MSLSYLSPLFPFPLLTSNPPLLFSTFEHFQMSRFFCQVLFCHGCETGRVLLHDLLLLDEFGFFGLYDAGTAFGAER